MRSRRGFLNDLRPTRDLTTKVTQPTLVIATPHDGAVPFTDAEALASNIERAQLIASAAPSHFVWYANDYAAIAAKIGAFLSRSHD